MFGNDRNQLRQMYKTAWDKFQQQQALSPLEAQIAAVIKEHPEYHRDINQLEKDYQPENGDTNPFLHMGLHLGLREQLSTDRPAGIRQIHQQLLAQTGDPHAAEHRMIDCLAEAMWLAQSQQQPPDEAAYLQCLQQLLS
ncbi:MAG TPA: DUF1841 family protein [Gammaproteobacteria bacterium]